MMRRRARRWTPAIAQPRSPGDSGRSACQLKLTERLFTTGSFWSEKRNCRTLIVAANGPRVSSERWSCSARATGHHMAMVVPATRTNGNPVLLAKARVRPANDHPTSPGSLSAPPYTMLSVATFNYFDHPPLRVVIVGA